MADTATVLRAAAYAAKKHRRQRRKDADASPYINHPLELARLLAVEGGVDDTATLVAALLHDTVEDTDATREDIAALFGDEVAGIVAEVTDDKSLLKPERKRRQVEHAPHLSPKAKLVKLVDKISNLRDVALAPPHGWPLERRREYFEWGREVVAGLRGSHPRLEALFDDAYALKPRLDGSIPEPGPAAAAAAASSEEPSGGG